RIVLVLDGDEAGQKRANEVLELFVAQQVDLRILTLPEGSDPCDFLQQHGAEAFGELLEAEAIDALEHAFRAKTRGVDLERDVHAASQSLEELVSIIAKAPRLRQDTTREDRLREEKILQRLAARFRIDEQEVRGRMTALRRRQQTRGPTRRTEEAPDGPAESYRAESIDPIYRELLELLIARPELLAVVREQVDLGQAVGGAARAVYETMCRLADEGVEPGFDRLMLQFDHPGVKSLLVELDEAAQAKHGPDVDPKAVLEELIGTFKQKETQRRRPEQLVALREGRLDDSQQSELLEKIIQQEKNRQDISEPTDG
ncbi:MAG: toprim domain-containing protein, partial [Candidatus Nealsonbacteria bacterium]|nr:toprim domain-containing protein [Candidatus Nealsonbacteria bacterium]